MVACYTDLGKTGSNFRRKGFAGLLQAIRRGEIDCVIVKDLSRFGRNYLEAGNYIEKIFPFLGVRFIAVADGFDTGRNDHMDGQMASEIKNLVNDMYARDFSQKAKIQLRQRREEGSYVGGPPPYGYKAERRGGRRVLTPDEKTRAVVWLIYEKFAETESYAAVARELNKRHINPPCLYQRTGRVYDFPASGPGEYTAEHKGWNKSAVERILKSETYAGTLAQGKSAVTARDEKNRIKRPEEDWVVIRDAHEPLVDRELYQRTAEIRRRIQRRTASHRRPAQSCPAQGRPAGENIFDGVLFCGVCGRKMTECIHEGQCAGGIAVRDPEALFSPLIRMAFALLPEDEGNHADCAGGEIREALRKAEAGLRRTEGKIRRACEEEGIHYMDYREGRISQRRFADLQRQGEDRLTDLKKQREGQRQELQALQRRGKNRSAELTAQAGSESGSGLTRAMVEALIAKISVYPGRRTEVMFAFAEARAEGGK